MNCKKYRYLYPTLSLACFLLAILFCSSQDRIASEALADQISPHVLRFHIMANSDSSSDQTVKLEIRSLILDYIRDQIPQTGGPSETAGWLAAHSADIESIANEHLKNRQFSYTSHFELTNCYFPSRYYHGWFFPCGNYNTARIILGNGRGHNWWCVLYPGYCYVNETSDCHPDACSPSDTAKQSVIPFIGEHRPVLNFHMKWLSFLNPH